MLYGEAPVHSPPTREQDQAPLRRCSSESSLETGARYSIEVKSWRVSGIQLEACSRQPRKLEKKVITMGRFVNEFEWLDHEAYSVVLMDRTVKIFQEFDAGNYERGGEGKDWKG